MDVPVFILDFITKNPLATLIIALVGFVIVTTELWRGVKWLVSKLYRAFFFKNHPQQKERSLQSDFVSAGSNHSSRGKKSVSPTNLNEVQSTEQGFNTSSPTLPENIEYIKNKEGYLEIKK